MPKVCNIKPQVKAAGNDIGCEALRNGEGRCHHHNTRSSERSQRKDREPTGSQRKQQSENDNVGLGEWLPGTIPQEDRRAVID
ncbi:hypothetical protein EVAR_65479_1 [Eumeta japonica]|uniref:Uncharacterized protein n=1 Tax=Eumeta variegata TaxID=151549 RepID=A0A4C2A6X1_EUMVA|nr:hypothetical protein EVAR_65479_1 [Eumeta japonica]